jgi:protein-tyrosine phosphatase
MSEHDLDISAHRGHNLTQVDVDEADLVLVMTRRHADIIARDLKRSADKVCLLSEMAGEPYDIQDPYGGSLSEYRQTATELEDLIERGYARIMKLLHA